MKRRVLNTRYIIPTLKTSSFYISMSRFCEDSITSDISCKQFIFKSKNQTQTKIRTSIISQVIINRKGYIFGIYVSIYNLKIVMKRDL
jgi:hypothetical protein